MDLVNTPSCYLKFKVAHSSPPLLFWTLVEQSVFFHPVLSDHFSLNKIINTKPFLGHHWLSKSVNMQCSIKSVQLPDLTSTCILLYNAKNFAVFFTEQLPPIRPTYLHAHLITNSFIGELVASPLGLLADIYM